MTSKLYSSNDTRKESQVTTTKDKQKLRMKNEEIKSTDFIKLKFPNNDNVEKSGAKADGDHVVQWQAS